MGFSELWSLLDPNVFQLPHNFQQKLLRADMASKKKQYLLVDFNNASSELLDCGGQVVLNYMRTKAYWLAVAQSGFHVIVVRDGLHDAERGCIKLLRMVDKLGKSLNSTEVSSDTFENIRLEGGSASRLAFKEVKSEFQDPGLFEYHTASEEADTFIRNKARQLLTDGADVVIMSADASLCIGVPSTCKVFCPKRCRLHRTTAEGNDWTLSGPLISVQILINALNVFVNGHIREHYSKPRKELYNFPPLDSTGLCLVAAILGGERDDFTYSQAKRPSSLSKYMQQCLYGYASELHNAHLMTNRKLRSLVGATVLVLLWQRSLGGSYHSTAATESPDPLSLFDKLPTLVSKVQDSIESGRKMYWKKATTVFNFQCPFKGPGYDINVVSIVQILKTRLEETMDKISNNNTTTTTNNNNNNNNNNNKGRVLYKGTWGLWTSAHESPAINTEGLLDPLDSLSLQYAQLHRHHEAMELIGGDELIFDDAAGLWNWCEEVLGVYTPPQLPPGAVARYWKSFKLTATMESELFPTFTEATLFDYASEHGRLPARGQLSTSSATKRHGKSNTKADVAGVMVWDMCTKRKFIRDFDRHYKHSYRAGGGPLLDMSARVDLLKSCANKKFTGAGPLSAVGLSTDLVQPILDNVVEWWKQCLDAQYFENASDYVDYYFHPTRLNGYAEMVVALIYGLMVCLKAANANDDETIHLGHLVEACLLSPIFARNAATEFFNIGGTDGTECVKNYKRKWDNVVALTRGTLASAPVGSLKAARWTQLVDHAMKCTRSFAGPQNVMSSCSWYDGHGILMVLRLHSVQLHRLQSRFVSKALNLRPEVVPKLSSDLDFLTERCVNFIITQLENMPSQTEPPTPWQPPAALDDSTVAFPDVASMSAGADASNQTNTPTQVHPTAEFEAGFAELSVTNEYDSELVSTVNAVAPLAASSTIAVTGDGLHEDELTGHKPQDDTILKSIKAMENCLWEDD